MCQEVQTGILAGQDRVSLLIVDTTYNTKYNVERNTNVKMGQINKTYPALIK